MTHASDPPPAILLPRRVFIGSALAVAIAPATAPSTAHAESPPPGRPLKTSDVRSNKIDVHAQYALMNMSKQPGEPSDSAHWILQSVRTGALAGIYLSNQGVPALRAQAMGTWWGTLLPEGINSAVFLTIPQRAGGPILILRHSIASKVAVRDSALLSAIHRFAEFRAGLIRSNDGDRFTSPVDDVIPAGHCRLARSKDETA